MFICSYFNQLINKMDLESELKIQSKVINELRERNETIELITVN